MQIRSEPPIKTLRVRLKNRHAKLLLELACEVNQVWNYSQDLSLKVLSRERRFMSAFDIAAYTKGAGKEGMRLHSQTIQAVTEEYCTRRKQFKKQKLRWRVSLGPKRSLGWIPFKASAIQFRGGQLHYGKLALGLWDSYGLGDFELGAGSFSEDARGRWYANITVKILEPKRRWPRASWTLDGAHLKHSCCTRANGLQRCTKKSTNRSPHRTAAHAAHALGPRV